MASPLLALMRRETRGARGRLVFMTACLALGVAAVTGVASLVTAVRGAVARDARTLLAADVAIESRRGIPDAVDEALARFDDAEVRATAQVVELGVMVQARPGAEDARTVLAELKAGSAAYPLYGEVVTEPGGFAPGALADDEAIAAPELLAQLGVDVGDAVELGGRSFTLVAALVDEPDRVDFAMTLGPRIFTSEAGLERTGLVRFGSRVKTKRMIALDALEPERAARALVAHLRAEAKDAEYLTFKTFDRPSPGLTRALDNVGAYLGLVALLSLVLGGVGVAQVVRAWLAGRTPAIATLRSLGMRPREVFTAYLGHVLFLSLVGCAIGVAVGLTAPFGVFAFAPDLFGGTAPVFSAAPAVRGFVLGLGTALVFSVPPLVAVWQVSPARVLRAEVAPLPAPPAVRYGATAALVLGVFLFAWLQAEAPLPALAFTAGLALLVGVLAVAALVTSRAAQRLPRGAFGPTLRHGVAALARPGAGVVGAAVALGLGTLVVVALGLVGSRLEEELVNGAPPDAPTVFLVDVQPDQWDGVLEIALDEGAEGVDSTPVVMARLAGIGGRTVDELLNDPSRRGRSRWQLTREQRLTYSDALPEGNELVAGALWTEPDLPELSVEVEFARSLGVALGDTLSFDVGGIPKTYTVTSLREVDWASMRINFFLLAEPGTLEEAPGWRLAAARVPEANETTRQTRVVDAYPNVGVLRLRPLLERVAATLGKIGLAVRLLGGFTVLVGIAILAGAVAASSARRGGEAALLKTLGLTRRGVAGLFAVEFGLLGLVAGLFGGLGALLMAWTFLDVGLQLDGMPSAWSVPAAALGTAALAVLAGLAASRRALVSRPLASLRS
ncbi:MAG: FtsX-like permease family protein [Planctomycetota bacterium]